MADTSDANTVRTAGVVLCLIGCLALVAISGWNIYGEFPAPDSLERVSGSVVLGEVKTISTRTSIEKWVVIDVTLDAAPDLTPDAGSEANSAGRSDGGSERWIFPGHARVLADAVASLRVGSRVSGGASVDFQRLRWSDDPVRVIWSLSSDGSELVSYADVVGVEQASRYQSPTAGLLVIGLGAVLILGSRLSLGAT